MEINNYKPSFKAGRFTGSADYAFARRMDIVKFIEIRDKFINKYKNSDVDVEIYTAGSESIRLAAMIWYKNKFKRYVEETILARIFNSPAKFIEKVNNIVEKEVLPAIK